MKPTVRSSSLDALLVCHGQGTLLQKLADETIDLGEESNFMAARGTWCHYQAALILIRDHGAIGVNEVPRLPKTFKPSIWDERLVDWYIAKLLENTPPDHAFSVEEAYAIEFPRFILSGHIDVNSMNSDETEAEISDLKTGLVEVDIAEDNWQLLAYAVLLKNKYPTLKKVTARIYQKTAEIPVSEVEIDNLEHAASFLESKINFALDHPLTLETNPKCRYCKAIAFCPAYDAELAEMQLTITPEELAKIKVAPSLAELAMFVKRVKLIAASEDKLVEKLKERIEIEGDCVLPDGTTARLVDGFGPRKVIQTQAAHMLLADKVGEEGSWEAVEFSVGAAEDALVNHAKLQRSSKKPGVATAENWIKETIGHLITRNPTKKLLLK